MITVWLVHGTWARSATWCLDDSPLRAEIANTFPNSHLTFRVFKWSSFNSPFARHYAAKKLREDIRSRVSEEGPGARHWLIGHSHGGNVILEALKDEIVRRHVDAIVCMSTPFIHATERPLGHVSALFYWVALSVPFLAVAIMMREGSPTPLLPYAAISLAVLLLWRYGSMRLLRLLTQQWAQSVPLLIVRSPADEPAAMFAGGHLVTKIIVALFGTIPTLGGLALRTRGALRLAIIVFGTLLTVPLFVFVGWTTVMAVVLSIASTANEAYLGPGGGYGWRPVLLATPLLLFMLVGVVMFLSGAMFGCSVGVCSPYIEIIGEAAPPGRWTIFQLGATRHPTLYELRHSAPYEHPESLKVIVAWLSEHAKTTAS